MKHAAVIKELALHVEKYGGEEVTENVDTRALLTALQETAERNAALPASDMDSWFCNVCRASWHNWIGQPLWTCCPNCGSHNVYKAALGVDAPQPTDCLDCGRHYGNEYGFSDLVLPNDVWAAISPTGDEGGMLCPSCICKRLADRGLKDVPAVFRSGPCCVFAITDAPPPSCKTCGRAIKAQCADCLLGGVRKRIQKVTVDALRVAINDHGPITRNEIGSAAKRVSSRICSQIKQNPAVTTDAPPEVTEEMWKAAHDAWEEWIRAGRGTGFGAVRVAICAALATAQKEGSDDNTDK